MYKIQLSGCSESNKDAIQLFRAPLILFLISIAIPVFGQEGAGSPQPAVDLRAGKYYFDATYEMMGQSFPMKLAGMIKEDGATWVITENITTPIGEEINTAVLEKGTLILKRRTSQGTEEIDITFNANKVSGKANIEGKSQAISADTGGAVFADGAGANFVIASLPLAAGYTATLRNFDVRTQKVKLVQLKITGTEKITVPAGTFEAYKIELTAPDARSNAKTLWVSKDTRSVLRVQIVFEERNSTFTLELAAPKQ